MPRTRAVKFRVLSRADLIREARELKSEGGENPEYDRALAELIYWAAGGSGNSIYTEGGIEDVRREIGIVDKK